MQVEIFSDVVCPWCAVGKRRFEAALRRFAHADEVDVVWRSYELDPHASGHREGDSAGRLARKYGISREQALASMGQLTQTAAAEGLDFHLERARPANTFDAHRLLHFARGAGPGFQDALEERLFTAHFTEGADVADHETLVRLAGEARLDRLECAEILAGDRYADAVRADEAEAIELGVTGVPFFVVDRRFAIAGAQDADTIEGILGRAWAKAHPFPEAVEPPTRDGGDCEGGSCAV